MFRNKSRQFWFNIISLVLNAVAIIMMCTDQMVFSIDILYKESIYFGIFTFRGGSIEKIISANGHIVPDSFWGNYYGIKFMLAFFMIISVIYFIRHIFSYTFVHSTAEENRFIIEHEFVDINKTYFEYSTFPLLLFVLVVWIFVLSISVSLNDVNGITVASSPMLIILSVLTVAQFIINRIYRLQ